MKSQLSNPFPHIAAATDAAAKMISIQAELFVLNQEIKTLRKIKQAIWAGIGLFLFNLLITFTFYWISVSLHEDGWSAIQLAGASFLFFGSLIGIAGWIAYRMGQSPHGQTHQEPREAPIGHIPVQQTSVPLGT